MLNGDQNRKGYFLENDSAKCYFCERFDVMLQFQSTVTISLEIRGKAQIALRLICKIKTQNINLKPF